MKRAREKISLPELGIEAGVRPRRTRTGGLLLEVKGPECQQKARKLAERVAAVLDGTGARVVQPTKRADLRITGLDESVSIEEGNLNHSRRAQDLYVQALREMGPGVGVMAEPYRIPDNPLWIGDEAGSVVITASCAEPGLPSVSLLERGRGYVAVEWGDITVVGVYISPNGALRRVREFLDGLHACLARFASRPDLVLGDFNAHATAWGSRGTNARGEAVLAWAASLDLRLLNRGSRPTCVRWQGVSIVDLTWATPAAVRRVSGWRVADDIELASDHVPIVMDVGAAPSDARGSVTRRAGRRRPRWGIRQVDVDLLKAAALAASWGGDNRACRGWAGCP
ncbi:uncharacterized protein LOC143261255 [Megalopta genalis]|uniref:uncharacterized protein LOC143261255 n=1 Tax=Megalopta genalis TaxID=115081 RepID=UPI003FD1175C